MARRSIATAKQRASDIDQMLSQHPTLRADTIAWIKHCHRTPTAAEMGYDPIADTWNDAAGQATCAKDAVERTRMHRRLAALGINETQDLADLVNLWFDQRVLPTQLGSDWGAVWGEDKDCVN